MNFYRLIFVKKMQGRKQQMLHINDIDSLYAMQKRLLRGQFAVHETLSPYKSVEELWDGEI